jgi:hypothetical protein
MLGGDLAVLQAAMFDGDAFDAGALGEDGFVPAEVGCKVDDLAGHRVHGFIAFRGELHRVFCR